MPILSDRGQGGDVVAAELNIIEVHDGYVLRHGNSGFGQACDQTECHHVGGAEYGGWPVRHSGGFLRGRAS